MALIHLLLWGLTHVGIISPKFQLGLFPGNLAREGLVGWTTAPVVEVDLKTTTDTSDHCPVTWSGFPSPSANIFSGLGNFPGGNPDPQPWRVWSLPYYSLLDLFMYHESKACSTQDTPVDHLSMTDSPLLLPTTRVNHLCEDGNSSPCWWFVSSRSSK